MTETPHSLIERLLAEEGKAGDGRARLVAELSARVGGESLPSKATPEMMAARLDGDSHKERQGEADAVFAASPEALHDLASAAAFLDAVDAERKPAPADLVAAAVSSGMSRKAAMPVRKPWLRWQLVGAGIGLALAALAAVLIVGRQAGPVDPRAPLIAKPETPAEAPKVVQPKPSKDRPAMVPASSEDVVPVKKPPPKPAGGEEGVPAPRAENTPRFAPEAPDVMPGAKR